MNALANESPFVNPSQARSQEYTSCKFLLTVAKIFSLDTLRERCTVAAEWKLMGLLFRNSRYVVVLVLLGVICFGARHSQADSSPLYDLSGTMTINGNSVCTPSPCSETIQFSFEYGYNYDSSQDLYEGYTVPGTMSVTSFGSLGSGFLTSGYIFASGNVGPTCLGGDSNYMAFSNSSNADEIDLHFCAIQETSPIAPSLTGTDLYGCTSSTCAKDFVPWGTPFSGLFLGGTLETNVVQVPEGGTTFGYVVISLAAIGFVVFRSRHREAQRAASS